MWDLNILYQHFWSCDIGRILQVPLGLASLPDCPYWFYSKHGSFTVRTCYYHILSRNVMVETSSSGGPNILSVAEWKWLWGLGHSTPLESPHILVEGLSRHPSCESISSASVRRHIGYDPFCPLCLSED